MTNETKIPSKKMDLSKFPKVEDIFKGLKPSNSKKSTKQILKEIRKELWND